MMNQLAFTVLASVGLQGVRLLKPTLGENIVVFGLGLIGLMTIQILKANGCRVLGVDFDSVRCELANNFGIETVDLSKGQDPIVNAKSFLEVMVLMVQFLAVSTESNDVIHQAAQMCRKRGRIVLVGVSGLNLRRDDFLKKRFLKYLLLMVLADMISSMRKKDRIIQLDLFVGLNREFSSCFRYDGNRLFKC